MNEKSGAATFGIADVELAMLSIRRGENAASDDALQPAAATLLVSADEGSGRLRRRR